MENKELVVIAGKIRSVARKIEMYSETKSGAGISLDNIVEDLGELADEIDQIAMPIAVIYPDEVK